MTAQALVRHIRRNNANVTDHRFRSVVRYENKRRPTLCGAEPTEHDASRKEAVHFIRTWRPTLSHPSTPQHALDFDAQLCKDCEALL